MGTVPVSEDFAWALNFKKFFLNSGGLVVIESVGVFFPSLNEEVESGWVDGYVGALGDGFISKEVNIN